MSIGNRKYCQLQYLRFLILCKGLELHATLPHTVKSLAAAGYLQVGHSRDGSISRIAGIRICGGPAAQREYMRRTRSVAVAVGSFHDNVPRHGELRRCGAVRRYWLSCGRENSRECLVQRLPESDEVCG